MTNDDELKPWFNFKPLADFKPQADFSFQSAKGWTDPEIAAGSDSETRLGLERSAPDVAEKLKRDSERKRKLGILRGSKPGMFNI